MWQSKWTTHTRRGKGQRHYCYRCNGLIRFGQLYERSVWRPQHSVRLQIMFEHAREEDCEAELFEMESVCIEVTTSSIAITTVLKERVVAKETIDGNTVYETELYADVEVAEPEPPTFDADEDIGF